MDEIRITVPAERQFAAVAGLVLGGVAARHALTLDVLDDLQLAFESLLERETDQSDVTIVLQVEAETIDAQVGPFARDAVSELEHDAGEGLGLRRLLETVVDDVSLSDREDGCWVELRKGYALAESS